MKRASLLDLQPLVTHVIRGSSLSDRVTDVRLEEGQDNDGIEFIRVILGVRSPDDFRWSMLQPLARAIEDKVGELDERFPSIRLAEAA